MAFTLEQLDDLEARMASGAQITQFGGRSVTLYDLEQLLALRAEMRRALNPSTTHAYRFAAHDKGV